MKNISFLNHQVKLSECLCIVVEQFQCMIYYDERAVHSLRASRSGQSQPDKGMHVRKKHSLMVSNSSSYEGKSLLIVVVFDLLKRLFDCFFFHQSAMAAVFGAANFASRRTSVVLALRADVSSSAEADVADFNASVQTFSGSARHLGNRSLERNLGRVAPAKLALITVVGIAAIAVLANLNAAIETLRRIARRRGSGAVVAPV